MIALANEITHSLSGAPTTLGEELVRGANDEQVQDAGKRRWLWFVDESTVT